MGWWFHTPKKHVCIVVANHDLISRILWSQEYLRGARQWCLFKIPVNSIVISPQWSQHLTKFFTKIRHKAIELTIKILAQSTFSPWFRWPKSPPFSALLDIAPAVSNRGAILRSLDRPPSRCSGKRNPGSTASRIFADGFRGFSLDSGMWYQPQVVFLTRCELDQ